MISRMSYATSPLLDDTDIRILAAIQRRGDISNVELASLVHLSASQCARRLEQLRRAGFIDRVVTLLDPLRFGLNTLVHTAISLHHHEVESNERFREFLRNAPEVLECYAQTGDADYLLKILVSDLEALSNFLDRLLAATGGVAAMRTSVVLKTIKQQTALPLQDSSGSLA